MNARSRSSFFKLVRSPSVHVARKVARVSNNSADFLTSACEIRPSLDAGTRILPAISHETVALNMRHHVADKVSPNFRAERGNTFEQLETPIRLRMFLVLFLNQPSVGLTGP
jgi:hypothetical protein